MTDTKTLRNQLRWITPILFLLGVVLYAWVAVALPWSQRHANDFKHMYFGMQALVDGDDPYTLRALSHQAALQGYRSISLNPYVYLPFTGLSLSFLQTLALPQAFAVWFIINHLCLIASLILLCRELYKSDWVLAFAIALIAVSFNHPLMRTLTAGQLNLVLLLGLTAGFVALRRGKQVFAAILLGFCAMFKLTPGLFFLYFLLRRRVSAFRVMAATCAALGALSLLAVGLQIHLDFLPMLRQMGYGRSSWEQHGATFWKDPANQSINSLFTHLVVGGGNIKPWFSLTQTTANVLTWMVSLTIVISYCAAICASKSGSRRDLNDRKYQENSKDATDVVPSVSSVPFVFFFHQDQAAYQATVIAALLLPSLLWDHYLIMLILPCLWMAHTQMLRNQWKSFCATVACYIVTAIPWGFANPAFSSGPAILLMSIKLFPTLVLYGLVLKETRHDPVLEETRPRNPNLPQPVSAA